MSEKEITVNAQRDNKYTQGWVFAIQQAAGDRDKLADIVNQIYEEGFEDGANYE